ncbi:MAG: DUF4254 domain-containing protein [Bacteroidetes bacterium]|nr:DUF4254 domain-containing protein [Bacteroidota bacterium]
MSKQAIIKNSISAQSIIKTCDKVIDHYHQSDILEPEIPSINEHGSLNDIIAVKCLIDTTQWHLEDEVRSPQLTPAEGWAFKKKIDVYNQKRTDVVELIDQALFDHYSTFEKREDASINSETPGWIIDRLSILCLKIYHMKEQVNRKDVSQSHIDKCKAKLDILLEQQMDLKSAFDHLMTDLLEGKKYLKLYLQMKMYNDEALNPVFYKRKR